MNKRNFSYDVTFTVCDSKDTICKLKSNPSTCGIDKEFTGIAYLHEYDEYDKNKGERIALLKARRKWHRAMCMLLNQKGYEKHNEAMDAWKMSNEYGRRYGADNAEIQELVKEK